MYGALASLYEYSIKPPKRDSGRGDARRHEPRHRMAPLCFAPPELAELMVIDDRPSHAQSCEGPERPAVTPRSTSDGRRKVGVGTARSHERCEHCAQVGSDLQKAERGREDDEEQEQRR